MHLQDFNKSLVEHCYIYFFMIYLEKAIKETNYEKSIEKWKNLKKFSIEKRSTLITVFSQFFKNGWTHWKINI